VVVAPAVAMGEIDMFQSMPGMKTVAVSSLTAAIRVRPSAVARDEACIFVERMGGTGSRGAGG